MRNDSGAPLIGAPFFQAVQKFLGLAEQLPRFQGFNFLFLCGLQFLETLNGAVVFLIDLRGEESHVGEPDCGRVGKVLQDGLAFLDEGAFLHVGQQYNLFQFLDRKLVGDVEAADAFHLVAEKLDAVRVVVGERKHIDQAATYGKLPRLDDEIHVLKLIVIQQIGEEIQIDLFPDLKFEGVFGQEFACENLFAQRLGITDNQCFALGCGNALQDFRPRKDVGVVGFFGFVGAFVGSGVEEDLLLAVVHAALAEQTFEVVVEISRVFLVGAHDEVLPAHLPEGFFHHKSFGRSRQIGTKQMPAIAQSFDGLRHRIDG